MSRIITIAIDGHSSTGKSTLAKQLAVKLGYVYVDSGAMYRCVALYAIQQGFFSSEFNEEELIRSLPQISISFQFDPKTKQNSAVLNGEIVESEIRGMSVSEKVSKVAAIPEVRRKLVEIQKDLGRNKGVVMDGRDIGTVVFPDAELKIFMTARPEVRARRRFDELKAKGVEVSLAEVLNNLNQRDNDDSNRTDSPLMVAQDARTLDNSDITMQEQFELAYSWAQKTME